MYIICNARPLNVSLSLIGLFVAIYRAGVFYCLQLPVHQLTKSAQLACGKVAHRHLGTKSTVSSQMDRRVKAAWR